MWWVLLACQPKSPSVSTDSASPSSTEVLVSELYGDGWAAWSLPDQTLLGRLSLAGAHPEVCASEGDLCLAYQARAHRSPAGQHQILYTFSPMNVSDGDELSRDDRHGWIAAVDWPDLSPLWSISALDFSGLNNGSAQCTWSEDDPCTPAADQPDSTYHRCFLYQPHEMAIVSDDGDQLELWVTDSRNSRLLRLRVTPGQTCAEVREVLSQDDADWGDLRSPNALAYWAEDGTENLLISMKDRKAEDGDGQGALTLWQRSGADPFTLAWRYPPEGSWYNAPHGLTRAEGPDGEPWLLFAHSNALGSAWDRGPGGTLALLADDADGPTHLADLTIPDGLHYPRDVLPLGPGVALVADSGCKGGTTCAYDSAVYWLNLPSAEPSGITGAWGESLDPWTVEPVGGAMLTEAERIYSVEPLEPSE